MTYTFNEYYIPDRMFDGIENYVKHHVEPGGFLLAVLENNLSEAIGRADSENMANLPAYVAYLYNEAAVDCHGSREKVKAWLARRKD